ncbi:MAG: HlyD family secretion protein [Gemmataceae bacterium]|nr:HlyD family secretion protein [Gemmataceae bacterium]
MANRIAARPTDHPNLGSLRRAATPRLARRAAWGVLLFVLAAVPVLGAAPWTQTVHGTGRAIAFNPVQRPQVVVSPIQGRVLKWHVVEGQKVRRHDRLVDLVDNDPRRLEVLQEQLLLADQRRTEALKMVDAQRSRLQNVKDERPYLVAQAKARLAEAKALEIGAEVEKIAAEATRERAEFKRDRAKGLYEPKRPGEKAGRAVSLDEVEETERELKVARQMVNARQAQIDALGKRVEAQKADVDAVDQRTDALIDTETAALAAREAEQKAVEQQYLVMRSEVFRQQNQFVPAPVDGTVFRILANAEAGGQLVNPGQQLAVLVPDIKTPEQQAAERDREAGALAGGLGLVALAPLLTPPDAPGIVAELLIDGNDLPLVRKGDRTLLQFEGWAAVQFAAYPEAAAGTFEGRVYLVDPTSDGQGRFRILVEPAPGAAWPDEAFLRQGVRAQGWVLIGDVTVGYEVWRLLNGFPPARDVKTSPEGSRLGPVGGK